MANSSMTDLYRLDDDWSAEQLLIVEQVRRYVDSVVLPCIGEHHHRETFPEEIIGGLRELGLFESIAASTRPPMA